MGNVPFRPMRNGATTPALKIRVVTTSGTAIDFTAAGRTNTVYIRNQQSGQYTRSDSATGVTGGSDSTLTLQWQAGDTDFTGPIAVVFKSTDSSGNVSYYPADGLLVSRLLDIYVTAADREVVA